MHYTGRPSTAAQAHRDATLRLQHGSDRTTSHIFRIDRWLWRRKDRPWSPATKTELTFNKYGDSQYLKQISVRGSTQGCLLATGNAEKKAKKSGKPTKEGVGGNAK